MAPSKKPLKFRKLLRVITVYRRRFKKLKAFLVKDIKQNIFYTDGYVDNYLEKAKKLDVIESHDDSKQSITLKFHLEELTGFLESLGEIIEMCKWVFFIALPITIYMMVANPLIKYSLLHGWKISGFTHFSPSSFFSYYVLLSILFICFLFELGMSESITESLSFSKKIRIQYVILTAYSIGIISLAMACAVNFVILSRVVPIEITFAETFIFILKIAVTAPLWKLTWKLLISLIDSASEYLGLSLFRKLKPDSYVALTLTSLLMGLKKSTVFESITLRSTLVDIINDVANCFQYNIPQSIKAPNAYERASLDRDYRNIANGFRSLNTWLYSPKVDTQEHLFNRLKENLHSFLDGAIDDLPRVDEPLGVSVTKKEVVLSAVTRFSNIVVRVAIPFLLLWVLQKIEPNLPENIRGYLFAGAFSLSSLVILIELDPNIGQKLDILKQVQGLMPGRKE